VIELRGVDLSELGQSVDVPEEIPADQAVQATLPGSLFVNRGFIAVPAADVRAYASEKVQDMLIGMAAGVVVGVLVGNVFDIGGFTRRRR